MLRIVEEGSRRDRRAGLDRFRAVLRGEIIHIGRFRAVIVGAVIAPVIAASAASAAAAVVLRVLDRDVIGEFGRAAVERVHLLVEERTIGIIVARIAVTVTRRVGRRLAAAAAATAIRAGIGIVADARPAHDALQFRYGQCSQHHLLLACLLSVPMWNITGTNFVSIMISNKSSFFRSAHAGKTFSIGA